LTHIEDEVMLRVWELFSYSVPIMRVATALSICAIALPAISADTVQPASNAVAAGSWHLVILDGGRLRDVFRHDTIAAPVSLARSDDDQRNAAAWSLQLGIVRPSAHLHNVSFGPAKGIPVAGDFNGDGFAELGVFRDGLWYLDMNGSNVWDDGDLLLSLGRAGDVPVTGDWNQDGKSDLGVYTPAAGDEHSVAVVGDWTGTGENRIGLFRDGVWYLDTDGDGRLTTSDLIVQLGQAGDRPLVGDFNRDGCDELGVYRNGRWIVDTSGDHHFGADDLTYAYGLASDLPIVGDWDGDGRDQVGLLHR